MHLHAAIEHLRRSWLEGYAKSDYVKPAQLGFRQVCFNTIVDELNRLDAMAMEFEAQHHTAVGRCAHAELVLEALADWCTLHGVDHRVVLGLFNGDGGEGDKRAAHVLREARRQLAAHIVATGRHAELFTPTPERSRLAHYLLLKHSVRPDTYTRHEARMERVAHHAVNEPQQ